MFTAISATLAHYSLIIEFLTTFCLQTNVSTCVQGSPHLGQVRVFFFPPPVPLLEDPLDGTVSLEGGVGSVGALPKLPLIVRALLATTTLTILCTVQRNKRSLVRSPLIPSGIVFLLRQLRLFIQARHRACLQLLTMTGDLVGGGQTTRADQAATHAAHCRR